MFGKRNRSPLAWGRRDKAVSDNGATTSTDSASPEDDANGSAQKTPTPGNIRRLWDDKPSTSDPTQRLLTALGRFQRQVLKGKEGASQLQWSDECMNFLIQGVEIALEQGWTDVVEALTETGRVLQSYEDAGKANQCAPFLADSYEILCLMVGDLIVDKVRSGVMRKWRDRYDEALHDLTSAGLALVEDDDEQRPRKRPTPAAAEAESAPIETPTPPKSKSEEKPSTGFTGLSALPPLIIERKPEPPAPPARFEMQEDDMFSELPETADEEEAVEASELPEDSETEVEELEESAAETVDQIAAEQGLDAGLVELLDTLCDGLARIEDDPDGSLSTVFLAMDDGIATLEARARDLGWHGSVAACRRMMSLCSEMSARHATRDDKFFELAYGFGGVYGDAKTNINDETLATWDSECAALMRAWMTRGSAPVITAPVPMQESGEAPTVTEEELPLIDEKPAPAHRPLSEASLRAASPGEEESATDLLETARSAVAGGSIAEAKFFAMRAAVSIAKKEVAETEARVRHAETKHQECARSIEQGRELVQRAEGDVAQAESNVAEGNETLVERTRHTEGMQRSLDTILARIEDVEAKIRELQGQLDDAQRQREATETALEEAKTQEYSATSNLGDLKEAEQTARVKLEDARQQVKTQQRRLMEIEGAMEKARELLTLRRASVAEIEQTIEQVRSAESSEAGEGGGQLF